MATASSATRRRNCSVRSPKETLNKAASAMEGAAHGALAARHHKKLGEAAATRAKGLMRPLKQSIQRLPKSLVA